MLLLGRRPLCLQEDRRQGLSWTGAVNGPIVTQSGACHLAALDSGVPVRRGESW